MCSNEWHYWNRPIDNDARLLTVSSIDLDILNLWFHHDLQRVNAFYWLFFVGCFKQLMKRVTALSVPVMPPIYVYSPLLHILVEHFTFSFYALVGFAVDFVVL